MLRAPSLVAQFHQRFALGDDDARAWIDGLQTEDAFVNVVVRIRRDEYAPLLGVEP